jgi:hypothetical protein
MKNYIVPPPPQKAASTPIKYIKSFVSKYNKNI